MADAGAIRAGKTFVEMGLNDAPLKAGLDAAKSKFDRFMGALSGAAAAFSFGAIPGQINGFVRTFADGGREMYMLARRTGASVEELDELKKAGQEAGIGFDAISGGVRRMQRHIGDLQSSGRQSDSTLSALRLTVDDLAGLSVADRMQLIGERISEIGDAGRQTQIAMALFGKTGDELIPMFRDMEAARGRARDGGVMSAEDAARAFELSRAFEGVERAFNGIKRAIGSALAPAFTPVLQLISGIIKSVRDWIQEHEGIVQAIGWTVGILATLGAAIGTVMTVVSVAGVIISGLGAAITAVGAVVGAVVGIITSPFLIIAGVIGGLIYVIGDLGSTFSYFGEIAGEAWGGIVDAMKSGDLELAGRIATQALYVVWLEFKNWFMNIWEDIPGFFGRIWDRILGLFSGAVEWLQGRWQAFINWLSGSGSTTVAARPQGEPIPPSEQRRRELEEARASLRASIAQANRQAVERDRARVDELRRRGDGAAQAEVSQIARGTFNSAVSRWLFGSTGSPLLAAVNQLHYDAQMQIRHQEEAARALQNIERQQPVFQ